MNQMWQIEIGIRVGEYEHNEHIYFFGSEEEATRFGQAYVSTIWGEGKETTWDDYDACYYSQNGERAASFDGVRPFDNIVAMTDKGTLPYRVTFSLA